MIIIIYCNVTYFCHVIITIIITIKILKKAKKEEVVAQN